MRYTSPLLRRPGGRGLPALAATSLVASVPHVGAAEPPAQTVRLDDSPAVERLLDAQRRLQQHPSVQGTVRGGAARNSAPDMSGTVVASVLPSRAVRSEVKPGDSYSSVVVAAAPVDADGGYELKLDPSHPLFRNADPVDLTIEVEYRSETGQMRALGMQSIPRPLPAGRRAPANTILDLDAAVDEPRAVAGEPTEEQPEDLGCTYTVYDKPHVNSTIIVTGSETTAVSYLPGYTAGQSSRLGFSIKVGSGGWSVGSGTETVTNSSISGTWFPPGNGVYSYRAPVQVEYVRRRCSGYACGYSNCDARIIRPLRFTGGLAGAAGWGEIDNPPAVCTNFSQGVLTVDKSTATTWRNGFDLSSAVAGAVDASAQTGYSSSAFVSFRNHGTYGNKRICGKNDVPNGTPGWVMARI